MRSLLKRLEDLETAQSPIRYIVVHGDEEAASFHRWSASQEPFWGTTYVVISGVPPQEDSPLPPWLEGDRNEH